MSDPIHFLIMAFIFPGLLIVWGWYITLTTIQSIKRDREGRAWWIKYNQVYGDPKKFEKWNRSSQGEPPWLNSN